jgi:hypothetical protein
MIDRGAARQVRGGKTLWRKRDEDSHEGFLGRDCRIETSQVGCAPLAEQDVHCGL